MKNEIEVLNEQRSKVTSLFIRHMDGDLDYCAGDVADFIEDHWTKIKNIMEGT